MIELIGRDWDAAPDAAKTIFGIIAFAWGVFMYVTFAVIHNLRYKYIKTACEQGRSKSDRQRRRRENRNARREERAERKEANGHQELVASGKIYRMPATNVIPISAKLMEETDNETDANESKSNNSDAEQENTIACRLKQALKSYRIEKRDAFDPNCIFTYTDKDGNKRPIADMLDGAHEYYVAVNLEDEEANPIFLGCDWGEAEENLKRELHNTIEAQVRAERKIFDKRIKQVSKAKTAVKTQAKGAAKRETRSAINQ